MTLPVTLPDIKCYVTPPRGSAIDFSQYLVYNGGGGSMSINQNFGRQGDTATFTLVDPDYVGEKVSARGKHSFVAAPSFYIPTFSQVKIIDNTLASLPDAKAYSNGVLFAGYVANPTLTVQNPTIAEWSLSCVDYSGYANASVVYGQYEGLKMEDLVVLLVNKADCGIKAKTARNGGYIAAGPVIPRMNFRHENLTQALQKVSAIASNTTAYGWYVDENLHLHFYDQTQAPSSGVTVTDTPSTTLPYTGISITECLVEGGFKYEYDGQSLYNSCVVTGANATYRARPFKMNPQDQWVSNGSQSNYPLSFVPKVNGPQPTLVVGTALVPIAFNDGQTIPTSPWMIVQAPNGTWSLQVNFNSGGSVPSAGTKIMIWYTYETSITAQADNFQSQQSISGPNRGRFAKSINQSSITTSAGAYTRASREVAEFGHPQERVSFTTSPTWQGVWRAGQTFNLKSKLLLDSQKNFSAPLNGTFIITQCSANFTDQGFRTWNVTGVRVT